MESFNIKINQNIFEEDLNNSFLDDEMKNERKMGVIRGKRKKIDRQLKKLKK